MRIKPLVRRLLSLRVTTVWTYLYRLSPFTSSIQARKHIKIDDEEQNLDATTELYIPFSNHNAQSRRHHTFQMLLLVLLTLIPIVLILAYTIYKPPFLLIRLLQHHSPSVLYHVPFPPSPSSTTTNRIVALTIDDAPSEHTSRILDLLKRYNAHATFFVIGSQISYSASYPSLLSKIIASGHELGNHAWSDEPSISLPLPTLSSQIASVESLLPPNSNGSKYFRPGSGFFSQKMVAMVEKLGYKMVLGSIYPHDPQIHNPRTNAKHVLSMVREGAIIIMHDRRDYSLEQLEIVLRGLQERGWRVESVGGLLAAAEVARKEVGGGMKESNLVRKS